MRLNKYLKVIKELGAGASGQVYLCSYDKENFSKLVAVKKINQDQNKEASLKEALINSALIHPNIVQIYDVLADETGQLLLVYEYIEGVSLRDYLKSNKRIEKETALYIFFNLLRGLEYLHRNNIIHHDLSPRNIMIGIHEEVKILDFGLSQVSEDNDIKEEKNISGSLSYYDPYLIQTKASFDKEADLFSACLIFYELLSSYKLFNSNSPFDLLNQLREFKKIEDEDLELIGDDKLESLLKKSLSLDRKDRLSLEEIKNRISTYKTKAPSIQYNLVENETVTIANKEIKKKNKSNPYYIYVSVFVLCLAIWIGVFLLKKQKEALFFIKVTNQIYKAQIPSYYEKIKNYHDIHQLFSAQACDYFYYSFISSAILLDEENSKKFKVNKENHKKYLERYIQASPVFLEKCDNRRYKEVQIMLSNFDYDKEQSLKSIINFHEKDIVLLGSYEQASNWQKNNLYLASKSIKYDLFTMEYQDQNITACNELSQVAFVHKIIDPLFNLEELENFSILGVEKNKALSIEGIYDDLLMMNSFSDQFKNMNFCFFSLKKGSMHSYYGKLEFEAIKE